MKVVLPEPAIPTQTMATGLSELVLVVALKALIVRGIGLR
jgi:hypothetical protein